MATAFQTQIPIPGSDPVSAIINVPDPCPNPLQWAFIIAHGAGNDMNTPMLEYLAEGLAHAGHLAMRFNFPYRDQGKKSPDPQKKLEATWLAAFEFLKNHPEYRAEKIVAAGKSMGGRVAAQLAAKNVLLADRLIFYGYPLHAPGKTDKLNDAHLYDIQVPMLFFAGTRDALCDLDKLKGVISRMQGAASLEIVEGGDHSFKVPKNLGMRQAEVYQWILEKTMQQDKRTP